MELYYVAFGFILFDILTGLFKAKYKGNFNSTVMREGGYHKLSEVIVVIGAYLFDIGAANLDFGIELPVSNAVIGYLCLMELISIVENLAEVNPSLGKLFEPYLEKLGKGD